MKKKFTNIDQRKMGLCDWMKQQYQTQHDINDQKKTNQIVKWGTFFKEHFQFLSKLGYYNACFF